MKKELTKHFLTAGIYLLLVTLFNRYFYLAVWQLWVGGIIGTLLPYLDHILYVYYFAPHELTSQRISSYLSGRQLLQGLSLMLHSTHERNQLIFHTHFFQIIILILGFLLTSSSASLIGHGIILTFYLHLVVDLFEEAKDKGSLANWFKNLKNPNPQTITGKKMWIIVAISVALALVLAF